MAKEMGKHAIVIGAGIGGLLFARALANSFESVTILERDSLADSQEPRSGVPQGRHFHGLLAGGCRAISELLPGVVDDFVAAGAVKVVTGLSGHIEIPGYDPFPRRDAGICSYGLTRPLLELCVRRRVRAIANISWQPSCAVERLQHDAGVVTGVVLRDGRSLHADFVIDASGRGELTLRAFDEMGYARPRETTIGVDLNYATAMFQIPEDAAYDWNVLVTHPNLPPAKSGGALMSVIEGNRWLCGIGWRGAGEEPVDRESFIEWTRRELRTQTCYNVIKNATMLGKVERFLFRESRHRHFSELESLPQRLLPVADAICCFNPIHGQGMSVAALEAEAFCQLLEAGQGDLHDLARMFLRRTDEIIAAPWNMAAVPDFAYPDTRGERPPNLMQMLKLGAAFLELSARDASVHKLRLEITSLMKPYSAMMSDPSVLQRIQAVMMEMAQAQTVMPAAADAATN